MVIVFPARAGAILAYALDKEYLNNGNDYSLALLKELRKKAKENDWIN